MILFVSETKCKSTILSPAKSIQPDAPLTKVPPSPTKPVLVAASSARELYNYYMILLTSNN